MKSRYITWEIILAGLALTILAFYVVNKDGEDTYQVRFSPPSASVEQDQEAPPAPEPPPAELRLQNLEKLKNLEELKNLENIQGIEELKIKLKELKEVFNEEQLRQTLQNLDRELENLEKSEVQVQLDEEPKITIHKKYKTPEGEWTKVQSGEYIFRRNLNPENLKELYFDLNAGPYSIVGGNADEPYVSLRATGSIDSPEKLNENVKISVQTEQNATKIKIRNERQSSFFNRLDVETVLYVPSDSRIKASTNGGHVNARELANYSELQTNGGHITLERVLGRTEAVTKGGHITIKNSGGNLSARTSGGHISMDQFDGNATIKTSGGHLKLKRIKGSLSGSTSGGNINASILHPVDEIDLSTSAGNVSIQVPLETQAKVQLNGMNTSLDSQFQFAGNKNGGSIEGIIYASGSTPSGENLPSIKASCSFGNVSLNVYE